MFSSKLQNRSYIRLSSVSYTERRRTFVAMDFPIDTALLEKRILFLQVHVKEAFSFRRHYKTLKTDDQNSQYILLFPLTSNATSSRILALKFVKLNQLLCLCKRCRCNDDQGELCVWSKVTRQHEFNSEQHSSLLNRDKSGTPG